MTMERPIFGDFEMSVAFQHEERQLFTRLGPFLWRRRQNQAKGTVGYHHGGVNA